MSKTAMSVYPPEKDGLLPTSVHSSEPSRRRLGTGFCLLLAAICAGLAVYALAPQCVVDHFAASEVVSVKFKSDELCAQPSPLVPTKSADLWKELGEKYKTKEFLHDAVEWLGGAVRVP
jgi:Gly-Xaa carboxypeptidase